jgi:hypothetical protein
VKKEKLTCVDIEIAIASRFGYLENLIVPGVHWGLDLHECDVLVLSKAGYATEVEIKTSKSDLIADKKKRHGHFSDRIKYLYFALPDYLKDCIEHVPERAGIILVGSSGANRGRTNIIRKPKHNKSRKFSEVERCKMARLGAIRIWGLKQTIRNLCRGSSGGVIS